MTKIKCLVVGDADSDKSKMLISFASIKKSLERIPTVFSDYAVKLKVNEKTYILEISDILGNENYDRLRPLSYLQTDVFLVCFSVVNYSTFESVKEKWVPEILRHCQETPFLIVGTQIDLREESKTLKKYPITFEKGEKLAKELKAVKYVECSALTRVLNKHIF